ncbi:uncharacterized protein [Procambarus clarkii]|uniref:uncharacterized protein isoform X1 n=1 Tax=Procambarus clarkii TaxID=6728 RepID=UPI003742B7DE
MASDNFDSCPATPASAYPRSPAHDVTQLLENLNLDTGGAGGVKEEVLEAPPPFTTPPGPTAHRNPQRTTEIIGRRTCEMVRLQMGQFLIDTRQLLHVTICLQGSSTTLNALLKHTLHKISAAQDVGVDVFITVSTWDVASKSVASSPVSTSISLATIVVSSASVSTGEGKARKPRLVLMNPLIDPTTSTSISLAVATVSMSEGADCHSRFAGSTLPSTSS